MRNRMFLMTMMLAMVPALGHAKVNGGVQDEIRARLQGKTVVSKIEVKQIKILKQVKGDRMGGMGGTQNLEQTKDATIVKRGGISYADEAHAHPWLYAAPGTGLQIESVDFGRSSIEIEVKALGARESTVITFEFDEKLDDGFSARGAFDAMLAATFDRL